VLALAALPGLAFLLATPGPAQDKSRVSARVVEYKGWKNVLRLGNPAVELLVTLDVGPRAISYRTAFGKNVFKEFAGELGKSGEKEWKIRGGHRLWLAPEDRTRTYYPDNAPVKHKIVAPGRVVFTPPPEKEHGIQKELELRLGESGTRVEVRHRIKNVGKQAVELAPWALTVLAPGGLEIIPQPSARPHPGSAKEAKPADAFAPNRVLVMWPYADFKDPRLGLGKKYITLRQDRKAKGPIKFGLLHRLGWVAYLNDGALFVKHIPYHKGRTYPDYGCNFETFSNADMLEMESLGPLVRLEAGQDTELVETWELFAGVPAVQSEADIDRHVLPKAERK
jgi:hypothetical protein